MSKLTIETLVLTATAAGAVTAGRAVDFDDLQAVANKRVKGIAAADAALGEDVPLNREGVFPWTSGAAIAKGDRLVPDANGKAVPIKETETAITGISQANPGVVTAAGHGLHTGEQVFIHSVSGMVEVNGKRFTVTVVDANSFSIGVDTTGFTAYTAGGKAVRVSPDNAFAEALEAAAAADESVSVVRL